MNAQSEMFPFLERDFTVEKIMIDVNDLVVGTSLEECEALSEQYPTYDIIPLSQKGTIMGFWDTVAKKIIPITPKHLITNKTSIFQLLDLFENERYFFVLGNTRITGFVHCSDINNDLVKIPFYILLQSLESLILGQLNLTVEAVGKIGNKQRVDDLIREHEMKLSNDIQLNKIQGLYLSEILELGMKQQIIKLKPQLKQYLEDFRNRVSHADKTLLSEEKDIHKLKRIKDYCISALQN